MQLKSIDDITPSYRHAYVSPHFDDVVYSCGGTIGKQTAQGEPSLVITVFAAIPPSGQVLSSLALKTQKTMGFDHDTESLLVNRRGEDAKAISYLRADYRWLDYLDAIYRGAPPYYNRRRSIPGEIHHGDRSVVNQLTRELLLLHERLPGTIWYAPLGIGRHVDHRIAFSAAQHLLQHGAKVRFYEDFPYVTRMWALQKRLKELGNAMKPIPVAISETLHLRQEAAAMYASQVGMNFGSKEVMDRRIRDYSFSIHPTRSTPLERYWTY